MSRTIAIAVIIGLTSVAAAEPAPFPVAGTELTFASTDPSDTWTTKLAEHGGVLQYLPDHDILNFATKAGFSLRADGLYIVGAVLDGEPAPAPVRAIAFPVKKGGVGKVPGMFPTTYTVGAREKLVTKAGTFDAWKIAITDKANPAGAIWFAPGAGIVKIALPSGRVDELIKITVPAALGACEVGEKRGEDPAACTKLATSYFTGAGVTKNETTARGLFERACKHGAQPACATLGFLLEHGRGGATDAKRAIALYTAACAANAADACFNLGAATELGKSGVAKDAMRAAELYDQACKLDLQPACDDYKRMTGR